MGRSLLSMCKCAGYVDPGYFNRITLEIQNAGDKDVVLIVGQKVAQIVFMRSGPASLSYDKIGSYQVSDDLKTVVRIWSPSDMLPKLKRTPNRTINSVEVLDLLEKASE